MKKRGKWWAALVLVIGLAVVVLMAMRPPSEITLPSGTKVRYLGAVRADQPFTTERWIDRMGKKFLPANTSATPLGFFESTLKESIRPMI